MVHPFCASDNLYASVPARRAQVFDLLLQRLDAFEQIRQLRGLCHGVHLMAVKQEEKIPEILAMA